MRALLVLCFVAAAFAAPAEEQSQGNDLLTGFREFRHYEYRYESEALTGTQTPQNSSQSGVRIRADVVLSVQPGRQVRMDLMDVRLYESNSGESNQVEWQRSPNSNDFSRDLEQNPLWFRYQSGRVQDIRPQQDEQQWVLNIKRGILSQFNFNLIQRQGNYSVQETDVVGDCRVNYTVRADSEQDEMQIRRSRDFSQCSQRAVISNCTLFGNRSPNTEDLRNSTSQTNVTLSNLNINKRSGSQETRSSQQQQQENFIVSQIQTREQHVISLYNQQSQQTREQSQQTGQQNQQTGAVTTNILQTLRLRKVSEGDSDVRPANLQQRPTTSLVFQPITDQQEIRRNITRRSQTAETRQEVQEQLQQWIQSEQAQQGFQQRQQENQRRQQEVRSQSRSQEQQQQLQQLQQQQQRFEQQQEQQEQQQTLALMNIVQTFRECNQNTLRKVYSEFVQQQQYRQPIQQALSHVSTQAGIQLMTEQIQTRECSEQQAQNFLRGIAMCQRPIRQNLDGVLFILRQRSQSQQVREQALLTLGSLVNSFITQNNVNENAAPTEVRQARHVLVSELQRGQQTGSEREVQVALKAIGNAGLPSTIPQLMQVARNTQRSNGTRQVAIYAMWRVDRQQITPQTQEQLSQLFNTPENGVEVRSAAFVLLMERSNSQQSVNRIVSRLQRESDPQVASFCDSYLRQVAQNGRTNPQTQQQSRIAQQTLEMIANQTESEFSQQFNSSRAIMYDTGYNTTAGSRRRSHFVDSHILFTDQSPIPRSVMVNIQKHNTGYDYNLFEFGVRQEGLETYFNAVRRQQQRERNQNRPTTSEERRQQQQNREWLMEEWSILENQESSQSRSQERSQSRSQERSQGRSQSRSQERRQSQRPQYQQQTKEDRKCQEQQQQRRQQIVTPQLTYYVVINGHETTFSTQNTTGLAQMIRDLTRGQGLQIRQNTTQDDCRTSIPTSMGLPLRMSYEVATTVNANTRVRMNAVRRTIQATVNGRLSMLERAQVCVDAYTQQSGVVAQSQWRVGTNNATVSIQDWPLQMNITRDLYQQINMSSSVNVQTFQRRLVNKGQGSSQQQTQTRPLRTQQQQQQQGQQQQQQQQECTPVQSVSGIEQCVIFNGVLTQQQQQQRQQQQQQQGRQQLYQQTQQLQQNPNFLTSSQTQTSWIVRSQNQPRSQQQSQPRTIQISFQSQDQDEVRVQIESGFQGQEARRQTLTVPRQTTGTQSEATFQTTQGQQQQWQSRQQREESERREQEQQQREQQQTQQQIRQIRRQQQQFEDEQQESLQQLQQQERDINRTPEDRIRVRQQRQQRQQQVQQQRQQFQRQIQQIQRQQQQREQQRVQRQQQNTLSNTFLQVVRSLPRQQPQVQPSCVLVRQSLWSECESPRQCSQGEQTRRVSVACDPQVSRSQQQQQQKTLWSSQEEQSQQQCQSFVESRSCQNCKCEGVMSRIQQSHRNGACYSTQKYLQCQRPCKPVDLSYQKVSFNCPHLSAKTDRDQTHFTAGIEVPQDCVCPTHQCVDSRRTTDIFRSSEQTSESRSNENRRWNSRSRSSQESDESSFFNSNSQ
ncbi:trichohyalin-like isoform X1 [Branchiostoma lanceolatum]|uniref:trichohyalin-like isoform X1 n=1 Tax=Branchiostoma lanceolatum TaxID=7740 RepID=UPI00345233C2